MLKKFSLWPVFAFIIGVGIGAYIDSKTFDMYRILADSRPSPYAWDDGHVYGGKMSVTPFLDHDTGKEYIVFSCKSGMFVVEKSTR